MPSPPATEGPSPLEKAHASASRSCTSPPPPPPPAHLSEVSCHHDAAAQETGRHLAVILTGLHSLQPAPAPAAAPTFADAAAALMCSRLDHLWTASSASVAATRSPAASRLRATQREQERAEESRTHPRTQLVLQLLALMALRRAGVRSRLTSDDGEPSTAGVSARSGSTGGGADRDGLSRVVHVWLCQRAAALPSPRLAADSVYGDLRTLLMEWAVLTLPSDWGESCEEVRWRRACASRASTAALTSLADAVCVPSSSCEEGATGKRGGRAPSKPSDGAVRSAHAAPTPSLPVTPRLEGKTSERLARATSTDAAPPVDDDAAGRGSPPVPSSPSMQCDGASASAPPSPMGGAGARLLPSLPPLSPPPSLAAHAPPLVRRVLQLALPTSAEVVSASSAAAPCDLPISAAVAAAGPADTGGQGGSIGPRRVLLRLQCSPAAPSSSLCPSNGDAPSANAASAEEAERHSGGGVVSGGVMGVHGAEAMSQAVEPPHPATSGEERDPGVMATVQSTGTTRPRPPQLLDDAGEHVFGSSAVPRMQHAERRSRSRSSNSSCGSASSASPQAVKVEEELQQAISEESSAVAASPRAVIAADAQARGRRWGRLAPFVLHAPAGSEAADDVRAVLAALGFASAPDGGVGEPHSARSSAGCHGEAPVRSGSGSVGEPPCPLGRLPPLLVAHAWLAESALRTAWLLYVVGPETRDATAVASRRVRSAPGVRWTSAAVPSVPGHGTPAPLPCVALADARVSWALAELLWCTPAGAASSRDCGGDGDRDAAADGAAAAVYASCALSSTFESRLHAFLAYPLAGVRTAIAFGQGSLEEAAALATTFLSRDASAGAPPPLTLAAWQTYLELRYAVAPCAPRHSPPGDSDRDDAIGSAAAGAPIADAAPQAPSSTASLSRSDDTSSPWLSSAETERTERAASDANGDPVICKEASGSPRDTTPTQAPRRPSASPLSMSDATAAAAAASSATAACSATYAAVMDIAAVVFTSSLRHAAAQCMTGVMEHQDEAGQGFFAAAAKQHRYDEDEEKPSDAQQHTFTAVRGSASTSALSGAVREWPTCSLHHLLEHVLERDAGLQSYMWGGAGAEVISSPSLRPPRDAKEWTGGRHRHSDDPDAAPHTLTSMSTSALTAAAARLWLALVTVLCTGESDVAQYVRSVLLPPPLLMPQHQHQQRTPCSGNEDAGHASTPSLAPFTMPTLFHSTLEDLYRDEVAGADAGADAPASAPLCPADASVFASPQHGDGAEGAVGAPFGSRVACDRRTSAISQTSTAPVGHTAWPDSLSLCAAVALRHPRVVLRQAGFLWRLACGTHERHRAGIDAASSAAEDKEGGTATQDEADAARAAFCVCVARLVESTQLATIAGLPPPLAASTTGSSCSTSLEVNSRVPLTNAGAAARVSTNGALPAEQQHNPAEPDTAFPPPPPGDRLQRRLRLQLATHATAAPATALVSVSGTKRARQVDASDGAVHYWQGDDERPELPPLKRMRSIGAAADDVPIARRSAEAGGDAGAAAMPPPLAALAEVHVQWAERAPARPTHPSVRALPLTAPPRPPAPPPGWAPVPLMDLVADVLWGVLVHMCGKMPEDVCVTLTGGIDAMTNTSAPLRPPAMPRRATLQLRASPAHTALHLLWQALSPPPPLPPPHFELAPPCTSGTEVPAHLRVAGARRLEVVDASQASHTTPSAGVDICVYGSLAATLRGVLCTVLGFAVHACLHGVWRRWTTSVMQRTGAAAQEEEEPYAWLAHQLRLVHDELVQPLQRALTTSAPTTQLDASSAARSSGAASAQWLSYGPLACVLFPALITELDAALTAGGGDCSAAHRAACGAWGQLRGALVHAGVSPPPCAKQESRVPL